MERYAQECAHYKTACLGKNGKQSQNTYTACCHGYLDQPGKGSVIHYYVKKQVAELNVWCDLILLLYMPGNT